MHPTNLRWIATGLCAIALGGCAISQPPSTVPPTGWPDGPVTARPSSSPAATATTPIGSASASASATPGMPAADGVAVTVPPDYRDATALVTDAPSSGATTLVVQLTNDAGRTISVVTRSSDYTDLTAFLDFYVPALNAGDEQTVSGRKPSKVGGREGAELTLKAKSDGHAGALFVTLRGSTLIIVSGDTPDEASLRAIRSVATGLIIS